MTNTAWSAGVAMPREHGVRFRRIPLHAAERAYRPRPPRTGRHTGLAHGGDRPARRQQRSGHHRLLPRCTRPATAIAAAPGNARAACSQPRGRPVRRRVRHRTQRRRFVRRGDRAGGADRRAGPPARTPPRAPRERPRQPVEPAARPMQARGAQLMRPRRAHRRRPVELPEPDVAARPQRADQREGTNLLFENQPAKHRRLQQAVRILFDVHNDRSVALRLSIKGAEARLAAARSAHAGAKEIIDQQGLGPGRDDLQRALAGARAELTDVAGLCVTWTPRLAAPRASPRACAHDTATPREQPKRPRRRCVTTRRSSSG